MLAHQAAPSECAQRANTANATFSGVDAHMTPYLWITCTLAWLNALTNGFSLIVFALDKKNLSMRRLLLLLSLSETVLNVCMSVNLSVFLSVGGAGRRFASGAAPNLITGAFFLTFALFNAYIMTRNWCLVLIAGSRCEVVRNPLSTRSGQWFSPGRTLLAYAGLSLVSLGVYTPRMFEFTWVVYRLPCELAGNATSAATAAPAVEYLLTTGVHHSLDAIPAYRHYKTMLLFPLQTILPIFLIAGLSFLIIFTLRRRGQFQLPEEQHQPQCSLAARNSQDAATKTVMVLMVTFIICELPTFIFFVLNQTVFKALANYPVVRMHTTFIGNILVCMDSFSNFIIYSSTSNSFRDTVRRILRLPGRQPCRNLHALGAYATLRTCDTSGAATGRGPACRNSVPQSLQPSSAPVEDAAASSAM